MRRLPQSEGVPPVQHRADRTEVQKAVEEAEQSVADSKTVPHAEVMALLDELAGAPARR